MTLPHLCLKRSASLNPWATKEFEYAWWSHLQTEFLKYVRRLFLSNFERLVFKRVFGAGTFGLVTCHFLDGLRCYSVGA